MDGVRRGLVWLAVGVVACACSGCVFEGLGRDDGDGAYSGEDAEGVEFVNPFVPTELRIHPLTRLLLAPERGPVRTEAHVEFLDRYGDPVKALGQLSFVLYRGEALGQSTEQVARWRVDDFDVPDGNARAYDRVTHTYRVRLVDVPADLELESGLLLVATLELPDGTRLSSTHRF